MLCTTVFNTYTIRTQTGAGWDSNSCYYGLNYSDVACNQNVQVLTEQYYTHFIATCNSCMWSSNFEDYSVTCIHHESKNKTLDSCP